MTPRRRVVRKKRKAEPSPIWHEWLVGVELVFLRLSPLYWGYGIPHGDGSAVILVPGFLSTDLYLTQFRSWLCRIGYEAFYSGIQLNADCPNLLIRRHLNETIQQASKITAGKVHLIGYSLGGSGAIGVQLDTRIKCFVPNAA